ncbi:Calponin homology domain [Dillenia turbinata]|uniref:Kinesin-like protein n=1 Tax=Dillenia turbinata TaxID=194707 RepID=A0AAN8V9K1_9MAGN
MIIANRTEVNNKLTVHIFTEEMQKDGSLLQFNVVFTFEAALVDWLNSLVPYAHIPREGSEEELRKHLIDGTVLCRILNKLKPGSVQEVDRDEDPSSVLRLENLKRFLAAMDDMGLPRFNMSDLEMGSMKPVLECLFMLKAHFAPNTMGDFFQNSGPMAGSGNANNRWKFYDAEQFEGSDGLQADASYRGPISPTFGEDRWKGMQQRTLRNSPMSDSLEPTAALLYHAGQKFHEVFQLKQGRYADLPAAKISEMIKSNSLDNAPTQSLLSVVNGILDESIERKNDEIPQRVACLLRKVVQEIERRISTQAEHLRTQNNLFKAREEKYQSRIRILEALAAGTTEETQELNYIHSLNAMAMNQLQQIKSEKTKVEEKKKIEEEDVARLMKEKDNSNLEISTLKHELELTKKTYEMRCLQSETHAKEATAGIEERVKVLEKLLKDSESKVQDLKAFSESKNQRWSKKEYGYRSFMDFQLDALQDLRVASAAIKQEVLKMQKSYNGEFDRLGVKLRGLAEATKNYRAVVAENQRFYNELQELKGNIRVYCRVRPFLPGQPAKQMTIDVIGENGELALINPSKTGKDGHKMFKFNKVYGPTATQEEVFSDVQPLIRSILDGFNVCICAYGQTGSGKTYTMTGPNNATKETWGVNYRALHDLFEISQTRKNMIAYEISVQIVEIYNEQVRDLLSTRATSQPNGLAVPDASIHPVASTSDVMELMETGFRNRAVGATAMNERSSRSHSVVSVHVRGTDLETGATSHGSLHLVDLAGSERVDRSEVTGDRLREAQHINKSLSALGDVIFALAQKSPHVPYRNSKLTQLLQSSLGGQAKTLMFVQINPDASSYSETSSTLKFAERVSGVELGAARSNKEGKEFRELMDQVATLKDTIAKKDEEIERLHLLKDPKSPPYYGVNAEKRVANSLRHGGKGFGFHDQDNYSEGSPHSTDDLRSHGEHIGHGGDGDYEDRYSDESEGAETDLESTMPAATHEGTKSSRTGEK